MDRKKAIEVYQIVRDTFLGSFPSKINYDKMPLIQDDDGKWWQILDDSEYNLCIDPDGVTIFEKNGNIIAYYSKKLSSFKGLTNREENTIMQ